MEVSLLSRWILAARLVLLALALLAVAFSFRASGSAPAQGLSYSCPMHPEVKSEHAGDCPVCGMALEALPPAPAPPATSAVPAREAARAYVKPAVQHVFAQAIEAPAWLDEQGHVQALFYNDELAALSEEAAPLARFGSGSAASLVLSRTSEPPEPWDEATARVAFALRDPPGARLPARSVGQVLLPARRRSSLVVPEEALLALDDGPYALVRGSGSDGFQKRSLGIGKTQYEMVTVVSGLAGHEPVLTRNAFLLDAERRLRDSPMSLP
jgi:hypothetical protein